MSNQPSSRCSWSLGRRARRLDAPRGRRPRCRRPEPTRAVGSVPGRAARRGGLGSRKLLLEPPEILLDLLQLLDLLRRRLALSASGANAARRPGGRAPASARRPSSSSVEGVAAPLRATSARKRSGSLRAALRSIMCLGLGQEGDEVAELLLRPAPGGHHPVREARFDVRARLGDRLAGELLDRLTGLLG